MSAASTLYLVHRNLQKLCAYRGAPQPKAINERAFISSMTNPGYAVSTTVRPHTDVRGGARIIVIQFSIATPDTKQQFARIITNAISTASEGEPDALTETREVIIVTPDDPASTLYNAIDGLRETNARTTFEVYPMTKFMIVVPEHVMVPHHDILREDEVAQMCDMYHITRASLPIIRSDDPVAIWLGLRPRMVVRVQRLVDTVGIDIAYQRCV